MDLLQVHHLELPEIHHLLPFHLKTTPLQLKSTQIDARNSDIYVKDGSSTDSFTFVFDFLKTTKFQWVINGLNGDVRIVDQKQGLPFRTLLRADRSRVQSRSKVQRLVFEMLLKLNIDQETASRLMGPIISKAIATIDGVRNMAPKSLLMQVELIQTYNFHHNEIQATRPAFVESQIHRRGALGDKTVSATTLSWLKILKFEGGDDATTSCSICLDDFDMGSDVTKLPCSHVFHGKCIKQWLTNSNLCPMCRFKIPS